MKRSAERDEALQYLVETLTDRSDVRAVALVDERGKIRAGVGMPLDLQGLAKLAGPVARGEDCSHFDAITQGTDFFTRGVAGDSGRTMYLAALGHRVRKMHDAAGAIARILA